MRTHCTLLDLDLLSTLLMSKKYTYKFNPRNVDQLLKTIVKRIPCPNVIPGEKLRALIFDSLYDPYRGIITYVRVFDGSIRPNEKIFMIKKICSFVISL